MYSEIDLGSLLDKIAGKIRHFLECEASSIFIYDSLKEELYFEIATGDKQDELKKIALKKGEGVVGWIAEHEQPLIINDCASDPRFTSRVDLKTDFKTNSIVGVPVWLDNKLLGVLEAVNKQGGVFEDNDREMLEYISRFVAIPMQNAMLFKNIIRQHKEKDRLLELAKTISYSSNKDEVFAQLKDIICDIITPTEINVIVRTQDENRLYCLMDGNDKKAMGEILKETAIGDQIAVFPLKSKKRRLGMLELKVNKRIPDEVVSLIRGLAAFVAILIEKSEMQARMIEKEKIEKELQIARQIQQSFLPSESAPLKGLDSTYINIPSSEVGGDYYDIVSLNEDETIFTINDVSGHGIPASLLMSIFSTNFIYRVKKEKDMVTTISHLNNLIAETTDSNLFVTSFTCLLDRVNMKLKYVNAGHNSPVILRADNIIKLEKGNVPVGLFPEVAYEVDEMELEPGDFLVLYTDGIVEAENPDGEQYSLERLIDFLKTNREHETETIKEDLVKELKGFTNRNSFDDDVTFILIKIT